METKSSTEDSCERGDCGVRSAKDRRRSAPRCGLDAAASSDSLRRAYADARPTARRRPNVQGTRSPPVGAPARQAIRPPRGAREPQPRLHPSRPDDRRRPRSRGGSIPRPPPSMGSATSRRSQRQVAPPRQSARPRTRRRGSTGRGTRSAFPSTAPALRPSGHERRRIAELRVKPGAERERIALALEGAACLR